MNTENIKRVRDAILAAPASAFDMADWLSYPSQSSNDWENRSSPYWTEPLGQLIHACGTNACIAGFAAAVANPDKPLAKIGVIVDEAQDFLGLDANTARQLFNPGGFIEPGVNPYSASREQAAKVLDLLIESGEVRWAEAMQKEPSA